MYQLIRKLVVAEEVLLIVRFAILDLHPINKSFDRKVVFITLVVASFFRLPS